MSGAVTTARCAGSVRSQNSRRRSSTVPLAPDEALYLRSPDVTMPSGIKRVTQ
jgi:hypothetical protein